MLITLFRAAITYAITLRWLPEISAPMPQITPHCHYCRHDLRYIFRVLPPCHLLRHYLLYCCIFAAELMPDAADYLIRHAIHYLASVTFRYFMFITYVIIITPISPFFDAAIMRRRFDYLMFASCHATRYLRFLFLRHYHATGCFYDTSPVSR